MNRRGAVLVAALVALVLAGLVASVALTMGRQRALAGRQQVATVQVRALSLGALIRRHAAWDARLADSLPIGGGAPLGGLVPVPLLRSRDSLLRLGAGLFQLRSVAERLSAGSEPLARARMGLLLAPSMLDLPDSAAVAGGTLVAGPATEVSGADTVPEGFGAECGPAAGGGAGVISPSPSLSPLAQRQIARLISLADLRSGGPLSPAPAVDGFGGCVPAVSNWGDPGGGPCASRFPVIVLEDGTHLLAGVGQGLIIALGSVVMSGDFCFAGAIVALGDVSLRDRACVVGTVVGLSRVTLEDAARVRRSVCAVNRVRRLGWRLPPAQAGLFELP